MKRIKIPLALLAILLGVGGALAASRTVATSAETFALDPSTGQWVNVTGQTEGMDYNCVLSQSICTAQFTNNDPIHGTIIPSSEVQGTYQDLD